MRLTEGILLLSECCVDCAVQVGFVEQLVIQVKSDILFVPIHAPNMEIVSPVWILLQKVAEGYCLAIPVGLPTAVGPPGRVGQDVGHPLDTIIFQEVDFAARGPFHAGAKGPDGRPGTSGGGDFGPDFKPAVLEGLFAFGLDGGSGVFGCWTALAPIVAVGIVVGIIHGFHLASDGQKTVSAHSVGRLIPLVLFVTYETVLMAPESRVGGTVLVEFVLPDQGVTFIVWRKGVA